MPVVVTTDELWDALRARCCATNPWSDAKVIVQLRRDDVATALAAIAMSRATPAALREVEASAAAAIAAKR
jgi:hypothetical protein